MSTFIYPSIATDSSGAVTAVSVAIYRPTDGKTFDFSGGVLAFVSTTPVQRLFALTQDANNAELFIAKQGGVTGFQTTGLGAQFTDGAYTYLFYNMTGGTPIFINPAGVALVGGVEALVGTATVTGPVTVGGYSANQSPGDYILATPANRLATDGSGRVTAGTVSDKAGYSLAQAFPANFSSMSISGGGLVTATNGGSGPTAAQIATALLTDTTSSDFATAGSPGAVFRSLSAMIASNAFTSGALANATFTLDAHLVAILSGKVAVSGVDGSWTFYDPDGTTPRVKFVPIAAPGGRTVQLL